MSHESKLAVPIAILRSVTTELVSKSTDTLKDAHLVGEIEVRPKEQPRMSLGNYTLVNTPKRFIIRVTPESEFDAIVTQITKLGLGKEYELVLHIANYGDTTTCAEIWQV